MTSTLHRRHAGHLPALLLLRRRRGVVMSERADELADGFFELLEIAALLGRLRGDDERL